MLGRVLGEVRDSMRAESGRSSWQSMMGRNSGVLPKSLAQGAFACTRAHSSFCLVKDLCTVCMLLASHRPISNAYPMDSNCQFFEFISVFGRLLHFHDSNSQCLQVTNNAHVIHAIISASNESATHAIDPKEKRDGLQTGKLELHRHPK